MASHLYPLCLPYHLAESSPAQLMGALFTDEDDTTRYVLSLENKKCSSISHIVTATKEPTDARLKFISNNDPEYPLLLSVPASHNKFKLEVDISRLDVSDKQKSLVILKSYGDDPLPDDIQHYLRDKAENPGRDISKIAYSKIIDDETILINDAYRSTREKNLTISLWEASGNLSSLLFSFKIWVDELALVSNYSTPIMSKPARFEDNTNLPSVKLDDLNVAELRKAFNFSLHDGPEFRKTLAAYENDIPKLKKYMMGLQDEVRSLDSNFKRLLVSRNRILDNLGAVFDLQFNPVLKRLNIFSTFAASFKQLFDTLERNLCFVVKEVFNFSSFSKMISFCMSTTSSDGSYEPAATKRAFEKSSKEYYDWLHRYLSNEKDRPESKLLLKRKTFELCKFDYLNSLNSASNNQYFNQFLENLMKFANLPTNNGLLDIKSFRDSKESQNLLDGSEVLYLNGLSRFNSEKLQLHQMIEACRTNEELTKLLKDNSLNSSQLQQETNRKNLPRLDTSVNNLDLVFPNSPISNSPHNMPNDEHAWEDDQNPDLSGILYALGGQGKPGWHKEWVVLKKGKLVEYSDWRNGTSPINKPIDVALASVKPITKDRRQFCLEIITSQGSKHVFQAINDDERNRWVKALYNAGQLTRGLLLNSLSVNTRDVPLKPAMLRTNDDRSSPISVHSNTPHLPEENVLRIVMSIEGGKNSFCADCSSTESVEWISMNFMVVICLKCSSCHRNMGSHISRVKSLKLDNFKAECRVLLDFINNAEVNSYLEEKSTTKISANASDEARLAFIRQKYEQKSFVKPASDMNSHLVRAVQKIAIPDIIKLLNCGADPNISLQMNNPKGGETITVSLFEYSLRKQVQIEVDGITRGYFVVSELLLLHGCNIKKLHTLNQDIVRDADAQLYWESKRERLSS